MKFDPPPTSIEQPPIFTSLEAFDIWRKADLHGYTDQVTPRSRHRV
ncbi:MAG: hypothetical protein Q8L56_02635 [Rhodocyclaceae bacterium]|nr:hypothetical protein [Rhodocyclaceae bacterium]